MFRRPAILMLLLGSGCVRDALSECPAPPISLQGNFTLKVDDLVTGSDLTSTGAVRDATLMFFDAAGAFVGRMDVAGSDIGRPLELPFVATGMLQVSAWGNLNQNIGFKEESASGHTVRSEFLALKENTEYADNWYSPGDLYFGLDTLYMGADADRTVHITQKTARMAVTVRGLAVGESADEYYFSMCEQNDGFLFDGTPLRTNEWCKIREKGVFTAAGEFATAQPYYVIPSIDPADVSACNAGVCLYKVGAGEASRADLTSDQAGYITADGDLNVTGKARLDADGDHLALAPGQTTNVLISFDASGDLQVDIRTTAWDEVYRWSDWK